MRFFSVLMTSNGRDDAMLSPGKGSAYYVSWSTFMSYLLQVNIGPVQGFIDSARRTRDLAFGSWLLSELSRAAAQEIVVHNGLNSLIFPSPTQGEMLKPDNQDFSVANKITALIQQPAQELLPLVQQAVTKRLHTIRDHAYQDIPFSKGKRQIAEAQVEDLIELLWAVIPFQEQDYKNARQQLEALMIARKNTRDFGPVTWGEALPKSSIDGQLESVIPEQVYPAFRDSEEEKRTKSWNLYKNYGAGPTERLSGIDLLKRRGVTADGIGFPSTSHIAALPFLERLKHLKHQQLTQVQIAWNGYIDNVRPLAFSPQLERIPDSYPPHPLLGRYDGSMLLEDRLVDVIYAPGAGKTQIARLQTAKNLLRDFYRVLDQQLTAAGLGKARPNPYYAFLRADGDGMGAIIDALAEHGEVRHRELSRKISHFAGKVRGIVEKYRGALVYAGGDDVVAFLPLDTVLECASELAREFRKTLLEFADQAGHTPSLSIGIAIIHHLDSLRRARYIAQEAEHRAKGIAGKNALAITMSKRSGEEYHIAGRWSDIDVSLQRLFGFFRNGAIPVGTAYELRDLALRLDTSTYEPLFNAQPDEPHIKVIQFDALRILQRKLYVPLGKFPKGKAEEVEHFFKARLGIEQEPQPGAGHIQAVSLHELINELIVAQVIADAKHLAWPEQDRKKA
jgi:CRISPR-associated protein Cmr2